MFYSETLLQKTGPLAKVWLAANVERKLTKGDCLKTNIEKDVHNIVNTDQAPLALRLTSQLLLGVVRIYSRKARYLLDDCNEALMKIKLAFRPGNVDLPSADSHKANPAALALPDTITELDLFAPMPDPDEFLFGPSRGFGGDTTIDWGTSQVLPSSIDDRRSSQREESQPLQADDLGLDLGDDLTTPAPADRSIEIGRRAESARPDEPTFFDDDLGLDLGLDEPTRDTILPTAEEPAFLPEDDDMPMGGIDIEESNANALARAVTPRRDRDSLSPMTELGADEQAELERTFQLENGEDIDETEIQAQQRVKRRKVLPADLTTELAGSQMRAQENDRSKILKAPMYLPRDPMLLALMNMQRTGGFISNILGDGRSAGWAPELRGILSMEVVRRAGDLKRKRESGVPGLEIPEEEEEEEEEQQVAEIQAPESLSGDVSGPVFPGSDDVPGAEDVPGLEEDLPEDLPMAGSPGPAFDETTMPAVHPADSGPVSLGTKHTVHMLRERFGAENGEAPSPSTRAQQSVLFTELCPESRTSREDATKLFFETLVLGTKDAIKVEQNLDDGLGGPIRIRGKRGLWGDWAEMGVGNTQSQAQEVPVVEAEA